MGRSTAAVISAVVFGALASEALAEDIHVPGDFRKLQDALDAAVPGDRILLDRGTFRGPFDITTSGIEIVGSPRARIAGRDMGRYTAAIRVAGHDVTLRGIQFVRGGVDATADRVSVVDCTFRRFPMPDVQLDAAAVLKVVGTGASIRGNVLERNCRAPIGIEVVGSMGRVDGNRVEGKFTRIALRAAGPSLVVEDNVVAAPLATFGLVAGGPGVVVRGNELEATNLAVIGDDGVVEDNRVMGADLGSASISVEGDGNLVTGNEVLGGLDTGFLVRGDGNEIASNDVRWNGLVVDGLPWGHGFVTRGSGNLLSDNVADGCVGEAFRVVGNGEMRLSMDPSSVWAWMPVALGAGNTLDGCTGTGAGTCGVGNWTVGTSVTGSTFSDNAVDVVSGIDFSVFDGNSFETGGPAYRGSGNGSPDSDTYNTFTNYGGD